MSGDDPREGRGKPRSLGRRAIAAIVLGALVFVLLLAAGSLWANRARTRAHADQLSPGLDRQIAGYLGYRWARPPLGAPSIDGNAWEVLRDAADAVAHAPTDNVRPVLENGGPAPGALRAFAAAHHEQLEQMCASTRRTWSWVAASDGSLFASRPLLPLLRLARLRLAVAQNDSAARCLRVAAETVRMGQDIAAGGGMVGLQIGAALAQDAILVIPRCADHASPQERHAALADLELLASHAAPAGAAMEAETLMTCAGARGAARSVPLAPVPGEDLAAWRIGRAALAAWPSVCRDPARWRTIGYPRLLIEVEREQAARVASSNEFLVLAAPDLSRFFARDAEAQAHLRALVVALAQRDGSAASPLGDPFTGRPLHVERSPNEILVRSVGPDLRDDRGADDDIVVRVSTTPPTR